MESIKKSISMHVSRSLNKIKIIVEKPLETMHTLAENEISLDIVEKHSFELIETLNKDKGQSNILDEIKDTGALLADILLPDKIKDILTNSDAEFLKLKIEDNLVQIPWEYLYVGDSFLCLKFSIGRTVGTQQKIPESPDREFNEPYKMWIIANPEQNLENAKTEGNNIIEMMDQINENMNTSIIRANLDSHVLHEDIISQIRKYDIVHFAGHAFYDHDNPINSGWKFPEYNFTAESVAKLKGGETVPALVVSNACQSALIKNWELKKNIDTDTPFDLANAFMLSGVKHYLGTIWKILDAPGSQFAIEFYKYLFSGLSIGEALKKTRIALIDKPEIWASYVLYGDPSIVYVKNKNVNTENIIFDKDKFLSNERRSFAKSSKAINVNLFYRYLILFVITIFLFTSLFIFSSKLFFKRATDNVKNIEKTIPSELNKMSPENKTISPELYKILSVNKKELSKRIHNLLDILTKRKKIFNNDQSGTELKIDDGWTSKPMHLAIYFDPENRFVNNKEEKIIALTIGKQINEHTRFKVLNRIGREIVLEELIHSSSNLINQEERLSPDIKPVDLILYVEVIHVPEESYALFYLIDSENEIGKHYFIEKLSSGYLHNEQRRKISHSVVELLDKKYPLRGIITRIKDNKIYLNIGSEMGVRIDQLFEVIDQDCQISIESIGLTTSSANPVNKSLVYKNGWRVQCIK